MMLLPARGPVEHSSELISSAAARAFFRSIKDRYPNRIVIYDLPPVLATDDALSFLPQVDAALMVIGEGRTHREDLLRCLELLRDTPILGTVLNGSRRERSAEYAY
jgi:protein-tyrosine kinase